MIKIIKSMLITIVVIILVMSLVVFMFLGEAQFGQLPSGNRLERIKKSPNFKNGKFVNLEYTPDLTEGVSYYEVLKGVLFDKSKRSQPSDRLPSKKTDLKLLLPDENVLIWFGHSSYFIQVEGKKILVDPVFSGSASPIKSTNPSYKGSDVYAVEDFPEIDYLFISHDHWDHLDYETIIKLKHKVKKVITGLGVGAHFENWGYDIDDIIETDWNDQTTLDSGFVVVTTAARHFSGRGFSRNMSLWSSFVLHTPTIKIFIGGDSGYGTHFADIGNTYGPFDLVLLECGQYDKSWKYIHMAPEEVVMAAQGLHAKKLMPVHWSKFSLAMHAWDEPIIRVTKEAQIKNMPVITPMIGEKVNLTDNHSFLYWWENIK